MFHIFKDILFEGWVRSVQSYSRSLDYYHLRIRDGIQPSTSVINLFDVNQQSFVLIVGNSLYILISLVLFLYMKKRKEGFRLRWLLCIYDAINIIVALYIACATLSYKLKYSGLLLCNPINNDPEGYRLTRVFVLFYIQKYFEFFDTWFFLLRKSFRQVTFLHLFHHSSITVVVGSILPFDYNGDMYLPILLNSANHAAVYSHYLLTSLGIQSWWSPYITSMQLFQFTAIFAQSLLSYRVGPTCGSPDFAKVMMIVYMGSMVTLFSNFFLQRYVLQRPHTSLDLCGVIKRPLPPVDPPAPLCGTVRLNAAGTAVVTLPQSFRPPVTVGATTTPTSTPEAESTGLGQCEDSFASPFAFLLTPIGAPMPNLHVAKSLFRVNSVTFEDDSTSNTSAATSTTVGGTKDMGSVKDVTSQKLSTTRVTGKPLHRTSLSLTNLQSHGEAMEQKSFLKHNDRLIDGPLPCLPSILSADKGLSSLVQGDTVSNSEVPSAEASNQNDINGKSKKSSLKAAGRAAISSSSGLGRFCFTIAGGRANGVVCWYISPCSDSIADVSSTKRPSTEDWRTIS